VSARPDLPDSVNAAQALGATPFFASLSPVDLARLVPELEERSVNAGDVVFRQGEPGDGLYLIRSGSAGVSVTDAGGSRIVAILTPPSYFGEMALLSDAPRTATIVALSPLSLWKLPRERFDALITRYPNVLRHIAIELSRRLDQTTRRLTAAQAVETQAVTTSDGAVKLLPAPEAPPQPAPIARESSATQSSATGSRPAARTLRLPVRGVVALGIVALTALIWLLSPPLGLTVPGLRVLSGVVALLALGFLNLLPDYQLGLMLLAAWALCDVAPARVVAAGFATSTWFLLLAAMAIGVAVARSGLLYRVALEAVRRLPPSHAVRCAALTGFGTVFSPGMSSTSGRLTLSAPLAQDIAESLHFPPRSRGCAALGLAGYLGFGQLGSLFLTGSAPALVVYGLLPAETQARMGFGPWFVAALPAHLILGALTLAFLVWRYRPESGGYVSASTLAIQRGVLGGLSKQEWSAGVLTGLLLLCFVTQPLHGVNPAWLGVIVVGLLFLLGTLDEPSLRTGVNWGLLLYLGTVLGFGAVFTHVGLDHWLAVNLDGLSTLVGDDPGMFVLLSALVGAVVGIVLRAGPSSVVVSLALFPVAASIGVSAWVVGMVFLLTTTQFLFPQQSFYYLTAYYAAGQKSFSHAQARPVAIVYFLATFLAIAASIPFWRWLGLLG
jgi:CRP-like cAMP-binding protein/di/tricarboxylate transporter